MKLTATVKQKVKQIDNLWIHQLQSFTKQLNQQTHIHVYRAH